jgi:hypothetical protein
MNAAPKESRSPVVLGPAIALVGDRYTSPDGKLTLTVTGVGALITWSVDRGGEKPLHFNATPAEFAYRMAHSLEAGAIFHPAEPFGALPPIDDPATLRVCDPKSSSSDLPPSSVPSV